jgi:hypothetical protein
MIHLSPDKQRESGQGALFIGTMTGLTARMRPDGFGNPMVGSQSGMDRRLTTKRSDWCLGRKTGRTNEKVEEAEELVP